MCRTHADRTDAEAGQSLKMITMIINLEGSDPEIVVVEHKQDEKSCERTKKPTNFCLFSHHSTHNTAQCYRMVNLRHLKRENNVGNFHDFKQF